MNEFRTVVQIVDLQSAQKQLEEVLYRIDAKAIIDRVFLTQTVLLSIRFDSPDDHSAFLRKLKEMPLKAKNNN